MDYDLFIEGYLAMGAVNPVGSGISR
jgi:hypothetical protein